MQEAIHQNHVHKCLIALGANLPSATGTALNTLTRALELQSSESLTIRKISKWYSTPAFPADSGPDFINGAILVETLLSPPEVLAALHRIEQTLGRTRDNRWEARICDLDLLTYDDLILPDETTFKHWQSLNIADQQTQTPTELILPHPRLQDRGFVLVPLNDVAPDWYHPTLKRTVAQMLADLPAQDLADISPLDD